MKKWILAIVLLAGAAAFNYSPGFSKGTIEGQIGLEMRYGTETGSVGQNVYLLKAKDVSARLRNWRGMVVTELQGNFKDPNNVSKNLERILERATNFSKYQKESQEFTTAILEKLPYGEKWYEAETDFSGRFLFKKVPRGNYFVYTYSKVGNHTGIWLVPVEVKKSNQKISLHQNNATYINE